MDYFIQAFEKASDDWQLELLIESFNKAEVQKDLLLTIAKTEKPRYKLLLNALLHPRKIFYRSLGHVRGYEALDEFYNLNWCMDDGHIGSTIGVLRPHTVLASTDFWPFPSSDRTSFAFNPDPFFTLDSAERAIGNFWEIIGKSRDYIARRWFSMGNIYFMNGVPSFLVHRAGGIAERLVIQQILEKRPIWEKTSRLAWVLCLAEVDEGNIEIFPNYNLVSNMIDNRPTPIIDYEHGMPPHFNKSMFVGASPFEISFGDPFETIKDCKQSANGHFMAGLAESLLEKQKSYFEKS
jgi:hypothetical protein